MQGAHPRLVSALPASGEGSSLVLIAFARWCGAKMVSERGDRERLDPD
jgi:hypothetical protein